MTKIKITLLALFMAISIGASSSFAFAEETTNNATTYINLTISHVEQALAEAKKSDFNTAQVHIKAARLSSDQITDHEDEIKKAKGFVIQGQIAAKKGNVDTTSAALAKALDIYKSL